MAKLTINNRYGVIPNEILNNPNLSWKAKGLFGYLQSKPSNRDFAIKRIMKESTDGERSTRNGILELEKFGYLQRKKNKNEKGHRDTEYILHFSSYKKENPALQNAVLENPATENRQIKKNINSKIYLYIINKSSIETQIKNKLEDFINYRQEIKKPITNISLKNILKKIETWQKKYATAEIVDSIEFSIISGRQGIFEPRPAPKNTFQPKARKKLQYEKEDARENFTF